jgi:hypothetical protein
MRTKTLVFYVKVAHHPMRTKLLFFYLSKWQPPMRTKLVKKQDLCEEHSPYILYTLLVYGSPCLSSILGHCKLTQERMTHDDDDDIGILQPLCDLVLISYQLIVSTLNVEHIVKVLRKHIYIEGESFEYMIFISVFHMCFCSR